MATGTQVRKVLLQIQTDDGDSEAKIDALNAKADELKAKHPELTPRINTAVASAKLKILRDELKATAGAAGATPIIPEVDDAPADERITELQAKIGALSEDASMIPVSVDDADAQSKILRLQAQLKDLGDTIERPEISDAGILRAQADVIGLQAKLDQLMATPVEIGPKVDMPAFSTAKAEIDALELDILRLQASAKGIKVDPAATAGDLADALKIADLKAKAEALRIGGDTATAVNQGFRLKISPLVAGWGSLIAVGLAALPALAGGIGALAGGLLAAKLLIGSQKVKGPLYAQWTELSQGLMSVLRTSTLPLLQPLRQVFEQVGQWARALKPELTQAFGALAPLLQPLARGLESVVSGLLPGFVTLMRAAGPAVAGVSGLLGSLATTLGGMLGGLAPAVTASSAVLGSLGLLVKNLMPVVTLLSRSLAGALGPALAGIAQVVGILAPPVSRLAGLFVQLAGSALTTVTRAAAQLLPPLAQLGALIANGLAPLLPQLMSAFSGVGQMVTSTFARAIISSLPSVEQLILDLLRLMNTVIVPLLPSIAQLTSDFQLMQTSGILAAIAPVANLTDVLVQLANTALAPLMPLIQEAIGLLAQLANMAVEAMNAANSVLSIFGLSHGGGGLGTFTGPGLPFPGVPPLPGSPAAAGTTAGASYGASYGAAWGAGVLASTVSTAQKVTKPLAANLAAILASGVVARLSGTAAQVSAAIAQLTGAVTTDIGAKVISAGQGSALVTWLEGDGQKLEAIATRRAKIMSEIATAQKYAISVTAGVEKQDDLQSAAMGGWNGGPQTNSMIVANLNAEVQNIRKFGAAIAKLKKMGLNSAYISQLISMGPVAGGQLAEQLAASGIGEIRQINSAESQIAREATYLGQASANAMYDSGAMAGKGFLSGLEAQQSALEKMMQKLAATMINTWKRELGIHSPSSVARQLAREWPNGLVLGLEDGHSDVMTASARMARAMIPQHGTAAGGGGGGVPTIRLDLSSVPREFRSWLKKSIRITGGDVQVIGA